MITSLFFFKGVTLSHSGRHFYSRFIRKGLLSFLRFDEILAAFRIDLQEYNMKVVTYDTSTIVKYAPEEQSEIHYTEISSNLRKENLPIKISFSKLSKRTIQDSIHQLIQTININQCIESQTGN